MTPAGACCEPEERAQRRAAASALHRTVSGRTAAVNFAGIAYSTSRFVKREHPT